MALTVFHAILHGLHKCTESGVCVSLLMVCGGKPVLSGCQVRILTIFVL